MDTTIGGKSTFNANALMFVVAADSREVFGANGQLDLFAIDLSSGQSRLVSSNGAWSVPSGGMPMPGTMTLFGAKYVLDSDYVYVAWHGNQGNYNFYSSTDALRRMKGPHDIGLFSRVKRDGSRAPELLGKGPDGEFIISGGYAYWSSRWEGLKRRPIVPGRASEMIWSAPTVPRAWPIGISDGRLYFSMVVSERPYQFSIASVPAASAPADGGAAEPRVHVASSGRAFNDAILVGRCVYSGGPTGVARANLEDGRVQPLIEGHPPLGDATVAGSRFLATDGRFLYWADYGSNRVVRWSK